MMYKIVSINRKNFQWVKVIESNKNSFNILNASFSDTYDKSTFTQRFRMRRRVKLLLSDEHYAGYIWYHDRDNKNGSICSMYIVPGLDDIPAYSLLVKSLPYKTVTYICEKNNYNNEILEGIGFNKCNGTLLMHNIIYAAFSDELMPFIEFEQFKKNSQEDLRCKIQNAVFESNERVPLNVEDIFFDEMQNYYIDDGAIFIKYKNQYIGYGQIIIENNIPTIVNFGIIKEFRQKGYGQEFMKYLLNLLYKKGCNEVKIRVNANNYSAINLYTKMGFKTENEQFEWKLFK